MVFTLFKALGLVMLVVFIFLGNFRATLIPCLVVPVPMVGTFAAFVALGFSINTLSLFGLVLAIGSVVDDAIVVVEAVKTHMAKGLSPLEATEKAMDEVTRPIIGVACALSGGLRAGGLSGRDRRPALPAVRPHPVLRGPALDPGLPDPDPGPVRHDPAPQERDAGTSSTPSTAGSTGCLTPPPAATSRGCSS